jgi:hypothetical protein
MQTAHVYAMSLVDPEGVKLWAFALLTRAEEARASSDAADDLQTRAWLLEVARSYRDMAEMLELLAEPAQDLASAELTRVHAPTPLV